MTAYFYFPSPALTDSALRLLFFRNPFLHLCHIFLFQITGTHGNQCNHPANQRKPIHKRHCHPENTARQRIRRLRHCLCITNQCNRTGGNQCTDRRYNLINQAVMSWSSFFVTLTRKSFDKIMPAFSFQMVSYIHWMNAGGYDYSRHIHNHWLHYLVLHLMKNDVC